MGELILQIDDNVELNSNVLDLIWEDYKLSIWCLGVGWFSLTIFISMSIYSR